MVHDPPVIVGVSLLPGLRGFEIAVLSADELVDVLGIPQYSAPSAVDLVKVIAERLIEGEPPPLIGEPQPDHDHHDHHGEDH